MKNSPERRQLDCLGLGIIPLDFLYTVKRLPEAGEKIDSVDICMQGGGPVPNALVGLSRLGMNCAVIGAVGNDHFGELLISELTNEGVDCRHILRKKRPSAAAVGLIEQGSGRRTIVLNRVIEIVPRDLKVSTLQHPRIVHLDGRDIEASLKLARWARKIGAMVSFDIGSIRNDVSALLPLVDHLVVADEFAFPFTRTGKATDALRKLSGHCAGSIVVTEGTKGSTGLEERRVIRQPAFRVEAVDATGAGDSFHAGYLWSLLNGFDMAERLEFGAATAAIKCTRPGARTGAPTMRQVRQFLREDPGTYA
ncbi:MAG: PfkB family carbohydrate kinase [candidate division Zixibacteria bacterium]|nr:PfkB family carbohydrate kinase [candidate division Zixibacteria bacterium]MDH3937288.1 PfkB family carbohydrate kinase [candidate division Zixibacteria bacterium]MDH4035320.1 PfkB family carbohydrate kinase [candidate division Zixibacteria bacterium]